MSSDSGLLELVEELRAFQERWQCAVISATYQHPNGIVVTLRLSLTTDGQLLTIADDAGNEYLVRMEELAE